MEQTSHGLLKNLTACKLQAVPEYPAYPAGPAKACSMTLVRTLVVPVYSERSLCWGRESCKPLGGIHCLEHRLVVVLAESSSLGNSEFQGGEKGLESDQKNEWLVAVVGQRRSATGPVWRAIVATLLRRGYRSCSPELGWLLRQVAKQQEFHTPALEQEQA